MEIKIGLRDDGNVEVISGLNSGDIIVAEGLKKVRPNSKIKPSISKLESRQFLHPDSPP